ncbi:MULTISPECIES: hypothetical protein [Croceitalea]|uniref:Transporter n=1 Tax=Croceitalea vernalis TaxID=3075599 RepID=A0ABU3BDD0_9FLAO|nr:MULTISPECIES: hypothetical protein [unclassified Croceitalea]MDT0538276.1 hypothetical protein [Croceitalea sp. P059]MDT0620060.1 hypothetical protein [Croceitalea sp. P007]
MKNLRNHILLVGLFLSTLNIIAQDDTSDGGSVIQNLTPSKLIDQGQWDLKLFNNLYTQNESTFASDDGIRQNFFTSTLEAFTGVSESKRVNVGAIVEYRANGRDFILEDGSNERRTTSGLTSIAPAIKFVPFKNVGNFSILSAFSIPLVSSENDDNGVFLDQNGFTWQNRFFYDYTFPGKKWQLFTELNSELNFGDKEKSFANNSLNLTPGVFLSYFPSSKFTVLGLAQHSQRLDLGNDFTQNFTALGGGAKYQLTNELNLEILYTNFVRGENTGLGETFNIGLRAVF